MAKEVITLQRHNRSVFAFGPDGTLSRDVESWLVDQLTFYERKFDFTAKIDSGGQGMDFIERKLCARHPKSNVLFFPLGMRPKIAAGLIKQGYEVSCRGGPVIPFDSPASFIDWDGLFSDFQLRQGQDELLAAVASSDGGIIAATTGYGKSVSMRMICRMYPKATIHVATKSANLADEIYNDLIKVIPDVGFVGGGINKRFRRVTVFVAKSLHHGMGDCDIFLGDEADELVTPHYARLLGMYSRARMFGFTATPTGRPDGRDVMLEAIFGPQLYSVSYQEAQEAGAVVPITVEWLRISEGPDLGPIKNRVTREQVGIWTNGVRNKVIADRVKKFADDEQVMVMVKTIDHAVQLKRLLPGFTLVYAANGMDVDRIQSYVRQGALEQSEPVMTKERLSDLRNQFKDRRLTKVISNYVWARGTNLPYLSILVRADAADSDTKAGQLPGRVCRRVPGIKESALVIDCYDEWWPTFLGRSRNRSRNYADRGYAKIWSTDTEKPQRGTFPTSN